MYKWETPDFSFRPRDVPQAVLASKVDELAACTLLVKHWPSKGSRHEAALALAGLLLHNGWSQDRVLQFLRVLVGAAEDEELQDRLRAVIDTAEKIKQRSPVTGGRRLSDIVDPRIVRAVCRWLGCLGSEDHATPARKLDWVTDAQAMTEPDPEWEVDGILQRKSTTLVYGPTGSYKSFFTLSLAYSKTTGEPWFGHQIDRRGPVIYVLGEGAGVYKPRSMAWKTHTGIEKLDGMIIVRQAVDLRNQKVVSQFIAEFEPYSPEIVVFDTLSRCISGADENAAQDMTLAVQSLDDVRDRLNATIVVVHHSGKADPRVERGSSVLKGAVDTAISMVKARNGRTKIRCEKQRLVAEFEPFEVVLMPVELEGIEGGAVLVRADQQLSIPSGAAEILKKMREDASLDSPRALVAANLCQHRTGVRHLTALRNLGLVESSGRTRNLTYRLTKQGHSCDL